MRYYLCSPGKKPEVRAALSLHHFLEQAREKKWVVLDSKSGCGWLPYVSIADIPDGMVQLLKSNKVFVEVANEDEENVKKVKAEEEERNARESLKRGVKPEEEVKAEEEDVKGEEEDVKTEAIKEEEDKKKSKRSSRRRSKKKEENDVKIAAAKQEEHVKTEATKEEHAAEEDVKVEAEAAEAAEEEEEEGVNEEEEEDFVKVEAEVVEAVEEEEDVVKAVEEELEFDEFVQFKRKKPKSIIALLQNLADKIDTLTTDMNLQNLAYKIDTLTTDMKKVTSDMKKVTSDISTLTSDVKMGFARLHKDISRVNEVAVNASIERWLQIIHGRRVEFPVVGTRLPYDTIDKHVEVSAALCLKKNGSKRQVPATAGIDGIGYLKDGSVFIAEVCRSDNLCADYRAYVHPTVPANTTSAKLLYKFVQVERAISACEAQGMKVFAAAIVSPSFRGIEDDTQLVKTVINTSRLQKISKLQKLSLLPC